MDIDRILSEQDWFRSGFDYMGLILLDAVIHMLRLRMHRTISLVTEDMHIKLRHQVHISQFAVTTHFVDFKRRGGKGSERQPYLGRLFEFENISCCLLFPGGHSTIKICWIRLYISVVLLLTANVTVPCLSTIDSTSSGCTFKLRELNPTTSKYTGTLSVLMK